MIADSFPAGGAESFVCQDIDCSMVGGTEGSVAGGIENFGGAFMVGSAYCHSSLLHVFPHSCK